MNEQLDFLADIDAAQRRFRGNSREDFQRRSWRTCWGWSGPEAGKPCSIDSCIVDLAAGGTIYAYTERCILIEQTPDGRWLAEIAMGVVHGTPWYKDGTRVILGVCDIWPPIREGA